jgi:REP element-mobilizing transposase RayT
MRRERDFRPGQLYGVTQRGNQGQWVYRDAQDFLEALRLMWHYAAVHNVRVHGWCLMHNHGHWIFEASTAESISNLMRDMQGCYSRYLNRKYRGSAWKLLAPLKRPRWRRRSYSPYWKSGPTNWSPRFDAELLDAAGFKAFLRYIELNPVRARLVGRAEKWRWSSASAHALGADPDGLLCLEIWREVFGNPSTIVEDWRMFVEGPLEEARLNALRVRRMATGSAHNRPLGWVGATRSLRAGAPPG